jgi:hypothetical protein
MECLMASQPNVAGEVSARRSTRHRLVVICAGVAVALTIVAVPFVLREGLLLHGQRLDRLADLSPANTGQATSAYVLFGAETSHSWKLFVGQARDKPEGSLCDARRTRSGLLLCQSERTPDGGTLTTSVIVLQALANQPGSPKYAIARDVASLTDADLPTLRLERNVRFIRVGGAMTSATEVVVAPASLDPAQAFSSSTDELERLATDPALVWQ